MKTYKERYERNVIEKGTLGCLEEIEGGGDGEHNIGLEIQARAIGKNHVCLLKCEDLIL